MEKHHRVEFWETWDVAKVTIVRGSSMSHNNWHSWKSAEILIVFIGKLIMVFVHHILLETDSKSIQNHILLIDSDFVSGRLCANNFLMIC